MSDKKNLIFVDSSHSDITDRDFDSASYSQGSSLFEVIHRHKGVNEAYLRTSLHWHDFYELEYIYSGSGTHILSQSSRPMSRGYVSLRTPVNLHSTIQDRGNPLKLYNIKFTEDFIPEDIPAYLFTTGQSLWVNYNDEELEEALVLTRRLMRELNTQDAYFYSVIKAIFAELFVSFVRKYDLRSAYETEESAHVRQAVTYINNNFRSNLNLKTLAEKLYLSPNYLGKLFLSETGKTCTDYIRDLRFALAVQLLLNTELTIREISDECGFHSASYFIRIFREKYGIPPIQFREQKRTPNA